MRVLGHSALSIDYVILKGLDAIKMSRSYPESSRDLYPHYKQLIFSRCCCILRKVAHFPHIPM